MIRREVTEDVVIAVCSKHAVLAADLGFEPGVHGRLFAPLLLADFPKLISPTALGAPDYPHRSRELTRWVFPDELTHCGACTYVDFFDQLAACQCMTNPRNCSVHSSWYLETVTARNAHLSQLAEAEVNGPRVASVNASEWYGIAVQMGVSTFVAEAGSRLIETAFRRAW